MFFSSLKFPLELVQSLQSNWRIECGDETTFTTRKYYIFDEIMEICLSVAMAVRVGIFLMLFLFITLCKQRRFQNIVQGFHSSDIFRQRNTWTNFELWMQSALKLDDCIRSWNRSLAGEPYEYGLNAGDSSGLFSRTSDHTPATQSAAASAFLVAIVLTIESFSLPVQTIHQTGSNN